MNCIICKKDVFVKEKGEFMDIGNEDEELAIDCEHPICPDCLALVMSNEYIKRIFNEWEAKL